MKPCGKIAALALLLTGCRAPWTVRALADVDAASTSSQPFDAARFVDSVWQSKAVPAAGNAGSFAAWRASGMQRAALVAGQGRVLRVDSAGPLLLVDLPPFDGRAELAVRLGEIHGSTLRDALPFIQFSQFVNQVEFARVSSALNERAATDAARALGARPAAGALIRFSGVASAPVDAGLPELIPILLSRESAQ